MTYTKWVINGMNIKTIEYSGHGFRMKEELPKTREEMVEDVIGQIDTANDYILFGHSMGAFLTYCVVIRLIELGEKLPEYVVLSACVPPFYFAQKHERFKLLAENAEASVQFMIKYNRMPEKRIRSKMFMEKIMPYIRNDYRILSEYVYVREDKLDIPAYVFCSKEDSLMQFIYMDKWNEYFSKVTINELKGDHFFIEDPDVAPVIMERLSRL